MRTWIRVILPDPQFKLIDSDSDPGPNLLGTVTDTQHTDAKFLKQTITSLLWIPNNFCMSDTGPDLKTAQNWQR
jgi:hypothetical protein